MGLLLFPKATFPFKPVRLFRSSLPKIPMTVNGIFPLCIQTKGKASRLDLPETGRKKVVQIPMIGQKSTRESHGCFENGA